MPRICIEYESEGKESQRRPTTLLDALDRGDCCYGDCAAEEVRVYLRKWIKSNKLKTLLKCLFLLKPGPLSTRLLQHEKRLQDELRGGKRKIKLVQGPVCLVFLMLTSSIFLIKETRFFVLTCHNKGSQSCKYQSASKKIIGSAGYSGGNS